MATVIRVPARWSGESGAELIEFALALPVLLLVGLGIFDFGALFQHYEVITNAAREGARVGILPAYEDADVEARVTSYLNTSGLNGLLATVTVVHPTIPIPGGGCVAVMTSVTVEYPQTYGLVGGIASYFGGLVGGTGISATAQMRNEVPAVCAGP